jgi:hypothetical protein
MSEAILDKLLEEKGKDKEDSTPIEKIEKQDIKTKTEDKSNLDVDDLKKPNVDIQEENKQLKSLEKALNDTKRSYQTANQKLVLSKKKYNSVIEEIKNTLFSSENSLLDEEEYNTLFNKLNSVFETNDEELETKEQDVKENKSKNIFSKLETEFENYKKYNKSKDVETNYKAFFDFAHFLNIEQRNNLVEYLEEVEPQEAIEKLSLMGQDYKTYLEKGIKKHGDILSYVSSLQEEISRLSEEINNSKVNIDNKFTKDDNKQIKHRTSPIDYNRKQGVDLLSYIMER